MASDRRGFVAPMTGLVMALLIGFVGLAVDTTRAWLVEARMKTALDAAALMAARRFNEGTRNAEATALFWANARQTGNALGGVIANPVITPVTGQGTTIRVSSTASTPTTFFNVIRAQSIVRDDFAVARRGQGLELAIVLDQTGSMTPTVAALGNITKMEAAKRAATRLVNLLYGCTESPPNSNTWTGCNETQPNLYISVLGSTRTLNVGTGTNLALASLSSVNTSTVGMPSGWTASMFQGCVRARADFTDLPPTGANVLRPYAWPSTFRQVGEFFSTNNSSNACADSAAYAAVNINGTNRRYCWGVNDWAASGTSPFYARASTANSMTNQIDNNVQPPDAFRTGPNLFCTPSAMLPLTARRTPVVTAISNLQAYPSNGGTMIAPALQGAWWSISPNWRTFWRDTNTGLQNIPPLPRDYDLADNIKAIVVLTDGDNNWYTPGSTGSYPSNVRTAAPGVTERFFGAYGSVDNWNSTMTGVQWVNPGSNPPATATNPTNLPSVTASSQSSADARLDEVLRGQCNAIRNPRANALDRIRIYVIGFEVTDTNIRSMLTDCASLINGTQRLYYDAANAQALNGVFEQIAGDLNRTRLIQ